MMRSNKGSSGEEDARTTLDLVVMGAMVTGVLFGALTAVSDATADHAALALPALDVQEMADLSE